VASQGDVYTNARTGTRVEIEEVSDQGLAFERRYPPGTGKADAHLHLDLVQSWTVVSGTATATLDGTSRRLGAGEELRIDKRIKHQDPYNESHEELRVRWQIEPVTEFIHCFMDAYSYLLTRDRLNDQDEFPDLQLFVILHATSAQSYAANLPIGLQRAALPLLALIGRLRGYRPSYS
jgi:mannose-6-phosphate isomerase-like protein (cupin superfamily)